MTEIRVLLVAWIWIFVCERKQPMILHGHGVKSETTEYELSTKKLFYRAFKPRISLPFLYSSITASTPHDFSSWAKFAPRRPSPPPRYAGRWNLTKFVKNWKEFAEQHLHPTVRVFAQCFQFELEFRSVGLCRGEKIWEPGEKLSAQRENSEN